MADRHTRLSDTGGLPILTDEEIAAREAENGLLQFDRMLELIEEATKPGASFRLRPSTMLELQRIAVEGLEPAVGVFRTVDVEISNTPHVPPRWQVVPRLVEELCDYVNDHWNDKHGLHLAAYVMWRLNWIHPFSNGNGRTARAVSYLALCAKLGYVLPGATTIPERIASDKQEYYEALDSADSAWEARGELDVTAMENLLREHLASQLVDVLNQASDS